LLQCISGPRGKTGLRFAGRGLEVKDYTDCFKILVVLLQYRMLNVSIEAKEIKI
jgi:hypothetical protein